MTFESDRRGSIATLSNDMFKKLLDAEEDFNRETSKMQEEITSLRQQLKISQMESKELDQQRRQSISTLHNSMFKKLLEAEDEAQEEIKKLNIRIQTLVSQIRGLGAKPIPGQDEDDISDDEEFNTLHFFFFFNFFLLRNFEPFVLKNNTCLT